MSNFYEDNHQKYFDSTVGIEPSAFLEPLARRLKSKATILDIGCGSGRDMLWFAKRGFLPTGFEQSPGLARLARKHANCPVIEGDFRRYNFSKHQFSALVLVGSLVHISRGAFCTILKSICQALKPGGMLLITLKEGTGNSLGPDGRIFTLWSKHEIENIFRAIDLPVLDVSSQTSKLRPDDNWLGYVLRFRGVN